MDPLAFDNLRRLPLVAGYADAFWKATGVPLWFVPAGEPPRRLDYGPGENPLCALLTRTAAGCDLCLEAQQRLLRGAGKGPGAHQVSCFAGLTDAAVPIVIGGQIRAALMSGQVFRRQPTERDFQLVARMVGAEPGSEGERDLRQAYFATPVVTAERFEAILQLLGVFANYLCDQAARSAVARAEHEPAPVASAKQFVQSHAEEPITLAAVVKHVHVSRFYFCKLFKQATGMTLTEYVARVRVEKAKRLLGDPSLRISEIVFAAGFGSIPQFNNVFKRQVGMAPTEYRASLRSGEVV